MKIAVLPNMKKDTGLEATKRFAEAVGGRAQLLMESPAAADVPGARLSGDVYAEADIAVVLGGDGSILQAAASCALRGIPILGINLGRIGFMSEAEAANVEAAADRLICGSYKTESRMMMNVEIVRSGVHMDCGLALNDAVISKDAEAKLISMALYSDSERVSEYVADGLVIATPTGSTGYNLSAGGPVVNPTMNLFTAAAICPHMLSARPMVMPAEQEIRVRLDARLPVNEAVVFVDGDVRGCITVGDEVIITRSEYKTELIKFGNSSFYDILVNKLS